MNMLKKILIIDDEPIIRTVVKRILHNELGYTVTLAQSGQEGIEKFRKTDFDLILLDIRMPDIDGLDVLTDILESKPEQRVIIITGYYTKETKEKAEQRGVCAFIEKPFTPFHLLETVKNALK
jgi:DNA-binding NtrC family response regulator